MNYINDCSIAKVFENNYQTCLIINSDTSVELFNKTYQIIEPFNQTTNHACWGKVFNQAITCNNEELIRYIVKVCGKQIFSQYLQYQFLPLSYVKTARIAQLLIDLGADVNTRCQKEAALPNLLKLPWTNKNDRVQIIKCLIRNGAEYQANTRHIKLAHSEIKIEIEFIEKGILLASLLKDKQSLFSEIQMPHDVILLIFKKLSEITF